MPPLSPFAFRNVSMNRLLRTAILGSLALSITACGGSKRPQADLAASKVTTIGVNSYLWRASLDTLSFMPLLQTDSNGGVIVTDWYVEPEHPDRADEGDRHRARPGSARRCAPRRRAARGQPHAASGSPRRSRPRRCRSSRTSSSPAPATCAAPRSPAAPHPVRRAGALAASIRAPFPRVAGFPRPRGGRG